MASRRQRSRKALVSLPKIGLAETKESRPEKMFGVFSGPRWESDTEDAARDEEALKAVRRFIEEKGTMPTQDSWTAAAMSPRERTIRKRFGRAAATLAKHRYASGRPLAGVQATGSQ